jgi:primary-amine oxidase
MTPHPLDPLSADEIRLVADALRRERGVGDGWRFASIDLREPHKALLRGAERPPRESVVHLWSRADRSAHRAVVSIDESRVVEMERVEGAQPSITLDEYHEADVALRNDPRVVEAHAGRGITDLDLVLIDTWAFGAHLLPSEHRDRRMGWADVWRRAEHGANPYANPVTGLHLIVDLDAMELVEIEDDGAISEPRVMGEYVSGLVPGLRVRDDLRPYEVGQPQGSSFTLEGNLLTWERWSLRVGFNGREGLVLHTVGIEEAGRVRSVAHRMSFAEMVVPYRDPTTDHQRRTAFDIGEWGLGFMTTGLELGCDCLGEITYLDAVLHDSAGEPYEIPNAICIHEEDAGVLWKHVDEQAGAEVRRQRRLVVSFHATVANYEYLVYWRFYEDGSIECEVRATGIMVTTHFAEEKPPYGTLVDERTYAPTHQHFIVARLDLDADGEENTVVASSSEALPVGPGNEHGLAVVQRDVPLRTELEGRQDYDWASQRSWKVVNEGVRNGLGTPVGYKLVPGAAIPPMLDPSSPILARAGVLAHTLWVTPYDPEERWPCGELVVQAVEDRGLPAWTARDRPIAGADVVLWYVFGIHHVTRPEDWPVMPVDVVSFWLKPVGFFDRNPALDVAPPAGHCDSGSAT